MRELSWHERGRLWLRLGIRLAILLAALAALVRFGPWLFSVFLPFLLAALVAWMLNPAVKWLNKKLGWPRPVLSLLLILLGFGVLFGLLWALGAGIVGEILELAGDWGSLAASLQAALDRLGRIFSREMELLPESVRAAADALAAKFLQWLETAVPQLLSFTVDKLTAVAARLPSFAVSTIVFVMASYFLSADWPSLRARAAGSLPDSSRVFVGQVKRAAEAGFGGYVRAEVLLSVGVFFILLAGFLFIRQDYALLLALLLAVLDFIPILGSGTVLVPWAFIDLFLGRFPHAVELMVMWGVVVLFRRVAEPKILGNQTGLSPILSLVSVYVGMRAAGVAGMVLGPVLCLVFLNICRSGVLDNALSDVKLAARDIRAILRERGETR